MLTGAALRSEAARLNIPGRSRMSADALRAAIAALTVPFRARNGKHKPSLSRNRSRQWR